MIMLGQPPGCSTNQCPKPATWDPFRLLARPSVFQTLQSFHDWEGKMYRSVAFGQAFGISTNCTPYSYGVCVSTYYYDWRTPVPEGGGVVMPTRGVNLSSQGIQYTGSVYLLAKCDQSEITTPLCPEGWLPPPSLSICVKICWSSSSIVDNILSSCFYFLRCIRAVNFGRTDGPASYPNCCKGRSCATSAGSTFKVRVPEDRCRPIFGPYNLASTSI